MAKQSMYLFLGLVLGSSAAMQAQATDAAPARCTPGATLASYRPPPSLSKDFKVPPDTCTSLTEVVARLFGLNKAAGRKLEKDKPLDAAAARAQRKEALADAEFSGQLKALQAEETEAPRRLLLEAALLDVYGHYQARELVLQELAAQIGVAK